MKFLKDLFTGKDNVTHDIGRWSWFICTISIISGAAANWYHGVAIDLTSFGVALSGIAGAHGIALGLKKDTEPSGQ